MHLGLTRIKLIAAESTTVHQLHNDMSTAMSEVSFDGIDGEESSGAGSDVHSDNELPMASALSPVHPILSPMAVPSLLCVALCACYSAFSPVCGQSVHLWSMTKYNPDAENWRLSVEANCLLECRR